MLEIDGHDMTAIVEALDAAETVKGKPTVIVATTVKGKGVLLLREQGVLPWCPPQRRGTAEALMCLGCFE